MDKPIGFSLVKITTEQFAVFAENFPENLEAKILTKLKVGKNDENKEIAINILFQFENGDKPFIVIQASCNFKIEEKDWENYLKEDGKLLLPKGFLTHLTLLTIGTIRGILHARTESTAFNNFVLPTIDITEMIKEDLLIE